MNILPDMPHEGPLVIESLVDLSEREQMALNQISTVVRRLSVRGYPHLADVVRGSVWIKADTLASGEMRRAVFFEWLDKQTDELIEVLALINSRRAPR